MATVDPSIVAWLDISKDVIVVFGVVVGLGKVIKFSGRLETMINLMWEDYCLRRGYRFTPLSKSRFWLEKVRKGGGPDARDSY